MPPATAPAPALALALAIAATLPHLGAAFLPFQNPPASWGAAQYNMSLSTLSMFCNSSGPLNAVPGAFGVPSVDWSNMKAQWAATSPMNDNELLAAQAEAIKAANPLAHVFTYRNLVKALPWFTEVREILADPAYAGFFLTFRPNGSLPNASYHVPACDATYDPPLCSAFYHDQEQSPAVPSPSNPNPDGACVGHCDCGSVPCGEYLFDWRNSSVGPWIIAHHLGGPNGLDNAAISGFFIDDFWCSNIINGTGNCGDPVQGPTEIDPHSQEDMGLSDQDIADITTGWLAGMTAAQQAILDRGAYTWSLIPGQDNANAEPLIVNQGNCREHMVRSCTSTDTPWRDAPLLHGVNFDASGNLTTIDADIASFLLMRGPWAWTGESTLEAYARSRAIRRPHQKPPPSCTLLVDRRRRRLLGHELAYGKSE